MTAEATGEARAWRESLVASCAPLEPESLRFTAIVRRSSVCGS